ncbi:hypothetical protein BVC80_1709g18 [Macleaya cordata]|uniref:Uncharacterized protein n=1 Tax=Macleaya cordata TaxID=56857 RepID=A0A200Q6L4_MACCD|nr:hypothetical protein BVC80_1709g18 [Macleaya cordata]
MKEKLGFFIWVLFLGINSCLGERNSLQVTSPESLKNVYECAIGNFGVPQNLVGTVLYPKVNQKACKGFYKFDLSFKSKPGGLPTILLVDRGDCYFKLKEWNAQNARASITWAAATVADGFYSSST